MLHGKSFVSTPHLEKSITITYYTNVYDIIDLLIRLDDDCSFFGFNPTMHRNY